MIKLNDKREIKFRAWNTIRMIPLNPKDMLPEGMLSDLIEEPNWYVMQYTGLKDKNGVEIYEGDIIKYNQGGQMEDWASKETVSFDNEYFGFSPFCYLRWVNADIDYVEVIGNIYENPEFLND